jgi:FkbM family methyltransferase
MIRPCWAKVAGLWIWADLREYICSEFVLRGCYDAPTRDAIFAHLPKGGVFVDVGANVGYHSISAAEKASLVIAIEASPEIARLLAEGALRNKRKNIKVENKACSDQNKTVHLFLSAATNRGKNSLCSANANSKTSIAVEAETLDHIVSLYAAVRVDVVKIDAEGAELFVLRGMTETITKFHPVITVELNDDLLRGFGTNAQVVTEFLVGLGYSRQPIGPNDFLFVHNQLAACEVPLSNIVSM